jgi:hypothetical protein
VVNIIPTPFNTIGGEPVIDEGFFVCTYGSAWPEESKARLKRFFASQGAYVELKGDQIIDMLGGATVLFTIVQALLIISDKLSEIGRPAPYEPMADYLRAKVQKLYGLQTFASTSRPDGLPLELLDLLLDGWRLGVTDYYREIGFPVHAAESMLSRNLDLAMHLAQAESLQGIKDHFEVAATKGGVMEKALLCLTRITAGLIEDSVKGLPLTPGQAWEKALREGVKKSAMQVRSHGRALAG